MTTIKLKLKLHKIGGPVERYIMDQLGITLQNISKVLLSFMRHH